MIKEACNRCCSRDFKEIDEYVVCNYCGQKETREDWELIGWRNISINKPFFSGTIHVYGKEIVGAHRDLSSNVNFICFFNLLGKVDFYTYKNKDGDIINKYLMKAGDASIMRAPRLNEKEDIRSLHGVEKVEEERIVLAIREIRTDMEEITNKGNWRGL